MATSLTLGASGADVNPLLVESTAPHGAPQFTQITNEHYKPAFEQAVRGSPPRAARHRAEGGSAMRKKLLRLLSLVLTGTAAVVWTASPIFSST